MIDFDRYATLVWQFLTGNLIITAGICIVLVIFFYKKPEGTIKFLGICALLIAVLYVMSMLTNSSSLGTFSKEQGIDKSQEMLKESSR